MFEHDRDEDVCLKWDDSCRTRFHLSNDGIRIFSIQSKLVDLSQKSGDQGPVGKRSDFNQALSTLNRLHRESG